MISKNLEVDLNNESQPWIPNETLFRMFDIGSRSDL